MPGSPHNVCVPNQIGGEIYTITSIPNNVKNGKIHCRFMYTANQILVSSNPNVYLTYNYMPPCPPIKFSTILDLLIEIVSPERSKFEYCPVKILSRC